VPARPTLSVRTRLQGLEVHYEVHGDGPPLVLVHGLGGSTAVWRLVRAGLDGFQVLAYDLRGLGQSSTPAPPYSLGMLVADLDALLEHCGLDRVAVLGHSLGGAVALAYAAERPERVDAVVAVSAPGGTPPEQRDVLGERARIAVQEGMGAIAELHVHAGLPEAFLRAHPAETRAYRSVIAGGDAVGYAALCAVLADLDLTDALAAVTAPVLLVHGDLDRVVPCAGTAAVAAAIRDCEVVELAGCGHVVPFERPEELASLAAGFLARRAR
jgi:pimeloyl-ACP methyl ester carboxylesterase